MWHFFHVTRENIPAKLIVQSGIREVVYYSDKNKNSDEAKASQKMFELAGIKYRFVFHFTLNLIYQF